MTDILGPPSKRMRLAYHHRHQPQYRPQKLPPHEPSVLPDESVTKLLVESIKAICEEEASKLNIDNPLVESVALESLHNAAEECKLTPRKKSYPVIFKTCLKIQRSMLAARRTVPIATDFETAIEILGIPRPDEQLRPYSSSYKINPQLLPTPPPEDPFHKDVELDAKFLGPDLSKQNDLQQLTFNPGSLPALPSAHTYKNSAVFTERETDSRKIRELATEEGKLGEQALRKLAGAVKLDTALSTGPDSRTVRAVRGPRSRRPGLTEEAVFEETMRDLLSNEPEGFELGPIVTSEKSYRMPDDTQVKRKANSSAKGSAEKLSKTGTAGGQVGKYNLLPPPRKSNLISAPNPDAMDVSFEP